jgi:two-component system chemotaxis response regulator CheB
MTLVTAVLADRSAAVRSVLTRLLEAAPEIRVVGEACDGAELVALVASGAPQVVVADLDLPTLAGRPLVEAIAATRRVAIFVLTPRQREDIMRLAFAAHGLGVIAAIPKPDRPEGWQELGATLIEAIRQSAAARTTTTLPAPAAAAEPATGGRLQVVGVGASTGGPGAIVELLRALGRGCRLRLAVVQHIAPGFEPVLADWLALETGLDVAVARDGEQLAAGSVRLAPAAAHLKLEGGTVLRLDRDTPPVNGHRPAVDLLFRSLLGLPSAEAAAVLLSGMGSDGAEAMAALRRARVLTIAQEQASCAVFGMPRAAIERAAAAFALTPGEAGRLLAHAAGGEA